MSTFLALEARRLVRPSTPSSSATLSMTAWMPMRWHRKSRTPGHMLNHLRRWCQVACQSPGPPGRMLDHLRRWCQVACQSPGGACALQAVASALSALIIILTYVATAPASTDSPRARGYRGRLPLQAVASATLALALIILVTYVATASAPAGGPRARGFLPRPAAAALGLPHLRRPAPRSLRVRKTSRPGTVRDFRLLRRLDSDTPTGFTAYRVRVIKKYLATKNPFPIQNDRLSAVPPLADAMWSSSPAPETIASSDSRPVTISSDQTPSQAQSSQPAVTISSTDESRTVEIPVACPVVDLTAGDSSPGLVESSSSSEDEADAELAEARHEAAQARVRLLEARVRERLASRTSRSNASSASEASRPPTPHEPVLPVAAAVTPPRSTWRRGRPLQGMMPPPFVLFHTSRSRLALVILLCMLSGVVSSARSRLRWRTCVQSMSF